MSKKATEFQRKAMSRMYRGKEIFKPLNTGWTDNMDFAFAHKNELCSPFKKESTTPMRLPMALLCSWMCLQSVHAIIVLRTAGWSHPCRRRTDVEKQGRLSGCTPKEFDTGARRRKPPTLAFWALL